MSDLDRLLAAFTNGALLRPSPQVPNIVDLSRACAFMAGAEGVQATPGSIALADLIGPAEHLIFILADGLGMNFIERLPNTAFLRAHLIAELRTVFPSATAVVLTSIATGEWPSRHAVTGRWTHFPEIGSAATIVPFVMRSNGRSLTHLGVRAEQAFPLPSIMPRITRDALALFPETIAESVFSIYFSGHVTRHGYQNLHQAVDIILARVRVADRPTYTYLYTPRLDGAAHRYGTQRPEVRAALVDLDREVERLAAGIGGHGRIVLSADHGFLDAPGIARHQIKSTDPLVDLLRCPPSGDTRVLYLHARDGAGARIREHFGNRFDGQFLLVSIEEAEHLGLFGPGPLLPPAKNRLGDFIAISEGPDVIEYCPAGSTGRITSDASHHSGLTPSEMRVPLVVA